MLTKIMIKLYNYIRLYSIAKIKKLEACQPLTSSKDYYNNLKRIKRIKSIWNRIRILPDTFDKSYIRKLLICYKLIHNI